MTIQLFAAALMFGLLAGYGCNWAADHLPHSLRAGDGEPEAPKAHWAHRKPLLIASSALAFLVSAWLLGPDPMRVAIGCLYAAFLLTVLVIDYEHRRVLNVMLAPAAVVAFLLSFLPQTPLSWESSLAGGAVGLGLFIVVRLLSRGHMGMGDVKLAGVIGLMLGYPPVINALLVGILLGAAAAIYLLVTRRATRRSYMAYAPYLALGALFAMWWYW
jgi:prepilin signal peptidase PulO-like enzyme (type II secretory pathway)